MTIDHDTNEIEAAILSPGEPGMPLVDERALARELPNDIGNARRLNARFGRDLLFTTELGWFVWNGRRWQRSVGAKGAPGTEVVKRAQATAEAIAGEADAIAAEAPAEDG